MPTKIPAVVKGALVDALSGKPTKEPHLSELAQHFTELVGGPRKLSKMLLDEFHGAATGGMVRMRILDIVFRATKYANERSGKGTDIGSLSDEDLKRELDELVTD